MRNKFKGTGKYKPNYMWDELCGICNKRRGNHYDGYCDISAIKPNGFVPYSKNEFRGTGIFVDGHCDMSDSKIKKCIPCRNSDCGDLVAHGSGCGGTLVNEYCCSIYERLIPLWEFQDKFEDKTKAGHKFDVCKQYGTEGQVVFAGVVADTYFRKAILWNEDGQSTNPPDCNLVPKKKLSVKNKANAYDVSVKNIRETIAAFIADEDTRPRDERLDERELMNKISKYLDNQPKEGK